MKTHFSYLMTKNDDARNHLIWLRAGFIAAAGEIAHARSESSMTVNPNGSQFQFPLAITRAHV